MSAVISRNGRKVKTLKGFSNLETNAQEQDPAQDREHTARHRRKISRTHLRRRTHGIVERDHHEAWAEANEYQPGPKILAAFFTCITFLNQLQLARV